MKKLPELRLILTQYQEREKAAELAYHKLRPLEADSPTESLELEAAEYPAKEEVDTLECKPPNFCFATW
ncbi:MAG: hypothetical protein WKG07_32630 [Hymenobacter sp.]